MRSMRPITIGDLCELTGYSRDQMRGLLAELPRFARRRAAARIARVYSNHDVLIVALLCRLETAYGLKRSAVTALCESIAITLATPREVSDRARLVLHVDDGKCEYVEGVPSIEDGLVVALAPIFLAIDSYLLPAPLVQREVGLSAVSTPNDSKRVTSSSNRPRSAARERAPRNRQRGRPSHG
jgi:hypothetical protein